MTFVRPVVLGFLLCAGSEAFAQQNAALPATIRIAATATIAAKPDRAQIDIGVVTQSQQATEAATENAKGVRAVLSALRHVMGEGADIQTASYTLTPTFRYPSGEEPVLTGYTATNTVRVTLDDLDKVGMVTDAAMHSGANRIQDIRFMLRDPENIRLQALREAAIKAHGEAETIASALGLKVLRVLSVDENGLSAAPVRRIMLAMPRGRSDDASTPIEAGTLQVNADITLTAEVGERHAEAP